MDLAEYEAIERSPLSLQFGDWEILTNPPPAIGGACLGALLLALDAAGPFPSRLSAIQSLIEVQAGVLAYRQTYLDGLGDTCYVQASS